MFDEISSQSNSKRVAEEQYEQRGNRQRRQGRDGQEPLSQGRPEAFLGHILLRWTIRSHSGRFAGMPERLGNLPGVAVTFPVTTRLRDTGLPGGLTSFVRVSPPPSRWMALRARSSSALTSAPF